MHESLTAAGGVLRGAKGQKVHLDQNSGQLWPTQPDVLLWVFLVHRGPVLFQKWASAAGGAFTGVDALSRAGPWRLSCGSDDMDVLRLLIAAGM